MAKWPHLGRLPTNLCYLALTIYAKTSGPYGREGYM